MQCGLQLMHQATAWCTLFPPKEKHPKELPLKMTSIWLPISGKNIRDEGINFGYYLPEIIQS